MMMKKIFALILSLMLLALPCLALAEESTGNEAVIGGADAPTTIVVAEEGSENTDAAEEEKPLTIMESLVFMVKGLVGIFLVTAMIILVLRILEKATHKKEEDEQ